MAEQDSFSRYARWALAAAAIIAAGSVGYRLYTDSNGADTNGTGPAPVAQQEQGSAPDGLAGLEARTRENPKDAHAWQALGATYAAANRYGDAARAYRSAAELRPRDAALWSALGETLVLASEKDPMPAEALKAFRTAHGLDARDPRARYFLAVARDVSGDHKGAIDDWIALLGDTSPGAPWEQDLRRTIEQVGQANGIETAQRLANVKQPPAIAGQAARGPTREQVEAASSMTPAQQRQMAENMVAQLETRLKDEPKRVDGWLLLIRSRMSLGQPDKAKAALDAALKANPEAAAEIRAQAQALGVN